MSATIQRPSCGRARREFRRIIQEAQKLGISDGTIAGVIVAFGMDLPDPDEFRQELLRHVPAIALYDPTDEDHRPATHVTQPKGTSTCPA